MAPRMTSAFAEIPGSYFGFSGARIMMTELAKTFGISSGWNRAINEQSMLKLHILLDSHA